MHNEAVVIGRVNDIVNDGDAVFVVVEDRSSPQYPVLAAARFWGDKGKRAAEGASVGALVKIKGSIKSREHKGKMYTDFQAWSLTKLEEPAQDDVRF